MTCTLYCLRMPTTIIIDAPAALAAWLSYRGSRGELARDLCVTRCTVWRWASRRSVPQFCLRAQIERTTGIPRDLWGQS